MITPEDFFVILYYSFEGIDVLRRKLRRGDPRSPVGVVKQFTSTEIMSTHHYILKPIEEYIYSSITN